MNNCVNREKTWSNDVAENNTVIATVDNNKVLDSPPLLTSPEQQRLTIKIARPKRMHNRS